MILHIKISLSNCSLFYDMPHLIHEKTMSCIWLSQSSYWLWELTGSETEDWIESKLPKLKKKSFCLCSIQFSIQRSNIFLSSSASAGEISPYKSMNLEKKIFFWPLGCRVMVPQTFYASTGRPHVYHKVHGWPCRNHKVCLSSEVLWTFFHSPKNVLNDVKMKGTLRYLPYQQQSNI